MISQESIQFHGCDTIDVCINKDSLAAHCFHGLSWLKSKPEASKYSIEHHPVALKARHGYI